MKQLDYKYFIVYKITNLFNNKIYIGKHSTNDLNDNYMGSSKILSVLIKKYGLENFKKEILYIFDNPDEMNNKEKEIVNTEFIKRKDTYNLNEGGTGSWYACNSKGLNNKSGQCYISAMKCKNDPKYAKMFKEKIKKGLKEFYKTHVDFHAGEKNPMYGKTHSENARIKISKAQSNYKNSQYGTMWITNETLKQNKKIKKGEEIPEGWKKGRVMKYNK